jgi:hypothetical protein
LLATGAVDRSCVSHHVACRPAALPCHLLYHATCWPFPHAQTSRRAPPRRGRDTRQSCRGRPKMKRRPRRVGSFSCRFRDSSWCQGEAERRPWLLPADLRHWPPPWAPSRADSARNPRRSATVLFLVALHRLLDIPHDPFLPTSTGSVSPLLRLLL